MYRGKYKVCYTRVRETRDAWGRPCELKEENFCYCQDIAETVQKVSYLLRGGCYDIWIEEVKDEKEDT